MSRYRCPACGYVYDERAGHPREGFPAGTPWAEVPDDWVCPDCAVRDKVDFEPETEVDFEPETDVDFEPDAKAHWRVDGDESIARLESEPSPAGSPDAAGKLIYTDEHGQRRRLPPSGLSSAELGAAAAALSGELGAVAPDYARIAVLERLTELHASGAMGDEDYNAEKRRLLGGG